jgi:hypothetical protein
MSIIKQLNLDFENVYTLFSVKYKLLYLYNNDDKYKMYLFQLYKGLSDMFGISLLLDDMINLHSYYICLLLSNPILDVRFEIEYDGETMLFYLMDMLLVRHIFDIPNIQVRDAELVGGGVMDLVKSGISMLKSGTNIIASTVSNTIKQTISVPVSIFTNTWELTKNIYSGYKMIRSDGDETTTIDGIRVLFSLASRGLAVIGYCIKIWELYKFFSGSGLYNRLVKGFKEKGTSGVDTDLKESIENQTTQFNLQHKQTLGPIIEGLKREYNIDLMQPIVPSDEKRPLQIVEDNIEEFNSKLTLEIEQPKEKETTGLELKKENPIQILAETVLDQFTISIPFTNISFNPFQFSLIKDILIWVIEKILLLPFYLFMKIDIINIFQQGYDKLLNVFQNISENIPDEDIKYINDIIKTIMDSNYFISFTNIIKSDKHKADESILKSLPSILYDKSMLFINIYLYIYDKELKKRQAEQSWLSRLFFNVNISSEETINDIKRKMTEVVSDLSNYTKNISKLLYQAGKSTFRDLINDFKQILTDFNLINAYVQFISFTETIFDNIINKKQLNLKDFSSQYISHLIMINWTNSSSNPTFTLVVCVIPLLLWLFSNKLMEDKIKIEGGRRKRISKRKSNKKHSNKKLKRKSNKKHSNKKKHKSNKKRISKKHSNKKIKRKSNKKV